MPTAHRSRDPRKVQVAELIPFGQDHQGVGVLGGVVFIRAIDDSFGPCEGKLFRVLHGLRVESLHASPSLDDLEDDGDGRRFADVIGPLLECQSEDGDYAVYYVIKRDNVQVGTAGSTSFIDKYLTAATLYTYTVQSVDDAGNVSSGALV